MARVRARSLVIIVIVAASGALAGCGGADHPASRSASTTTTRATTTSTTTTTAPPPPDVYAFTRAGMLAPAVQSVPARVYVPNGMSNTVSVIDPAAFKVIDTYPVDALPQHVVPSYDLSTLYVNNNNGNTLTPIDPRTGKPGAAIPVDDPYNLYFTPDGKYAVVMAERNSQVDFRDPHTWQLVKSIEIPHRGVNHADFTPDGASMIASCEFSGWVVRIDLETLAYSGEVEVGGEPIDVRLSPDGSSMYVANHVRQGGGVSIIDPVNMTERAFIATGGGAHGVYPSRDASQIYVTNRHAGSVSVIAADTNQVVATWTIPGGGSPDMGGVSPDGSQFWVSGRYDNVVYVFATSDGHLLAKIPVGHGPHGLAYFPQPGRYSLGHTGNYR
jgi:YVTN family beta-propeller protein